MYLYKTVRSKRAGIHPLGCDIHTKVEVRTLPVRNDRVIRELEREAATGSPEAKAKLLSCYAWKHLPIYTDYGKSRWLELPKEFRETAVLDAQNWLAEIGYYVVKHDPDIKPFTDNRNYTVFGILAGVRNRNVEPISEPRGFPEDASVGLKDWMDEVDHTPSWLYVDEILTRQDDLVEAGEPELVEMCQNLLAKYGEKRARMVFFFDN